MEAWDRYNPRVTELSDEHLMEAWRERGDRDAFEELFRRHAPRLRGWFQRSLSGEEVAKDLVQQTFLHLHRARADYRSGMPLRPWLYTIAANAKRQHLRTRRRKPETAFDPDRHEPSRGPGVSTPRERLVQRALLQLDEGQRDVVVLHYYQGFSFPEVAQILGISTSAAKVRAHRAYEKLRASLGKE